MPAGVGEAASAARACDRVLLLLSHEGIGGAANNARAHGGGGIKEK